MRLTFYQHWKTVIAFSKRQIPYMTVYLTSVMDSEYMEFSVSANEITLTGESVIGSDRKSFQIEWK